MAVAGIQHIYNFRTETFILQQNDPTYNPVINNRRYNKYINHLSWRGDPWACIRGPRGGAILRR